MSVGRVKCMHRSERVYAGRQSQFRRPHALATMGLLLLTLAACAPSAFEGLSGGRRPADSGGEDENESGTHEQEEAGVEASEDAGSADGDEPDARASVMDASSSDGMAADGSGLVTAQCMPGSAECASSTTQRTCSDAGEWEEPTECANACVGTGCGGSCRPGKRVCQDKQRQLCNEQGAWVNDGAPCSNLCVDGACQGACSPDSTQCVSTTQVQTCNASGQWDAAKSCPFACVGDRCGGECTPGARSCGAGNVPRVCSDTGMWRNLAACAGLTPVCQGAGVCRCPPGRRRCNGTQPQVCDTNHQWVNTGAPCANCSGEGQCPNEGCDEANIQRCGGFCGCACANNECGGGWDWTKDGCTNERRTACANVGCRCVDGACSGGMCDGTGCTQGKEAECKRQFGPQCGCALGECVGSCGS